MKNVNTKIDFIDEMSDIEIIGRCNLHCRVKTNDRICLLYN